jgi:hypothetical protein
MRVEEVSADELQVKEVEALSHQNVEELKVLVVTLGHPPRQGDCDAANIAILQGGGQNQGLLLEAISRIQDHAIEQVATLETLLLQHGLAGVGPVLLRGEVHMVLVQNAVRHLAQPEVVRHEIDWLTSCA